MTSKMMNGAVRNQCLKLVRVNVYPVYPGIFGIHMLLLALLLLVTAFSAAGGAPLRALDGRGRPVAWWVALKLPMVVQDAADASLLRPTPCDCAPPVCSNVNDGGNNEDRASGLCYLYADANSPRLRHFRELGFDCLGQGGDDPVSHTLRQKEKDPESYWAIFNDQLNGIARPFERFKGEEQVERKNKTVCSGGDDFSAHAKGAVAVDSELTGGFYLQASTPGFPDPSTPVKSASGDAFVRLGCQKDNNLKFAQHFAAFSLEADQLENLADALAVARLCSGNFYHGELGRALASDSLWRAGESSGATGVVASLFHALLDPNSTDGFERNGGDVSQLIRKVNLTLSQPSADAYASSSVFEFLLDDTFLPTINDKLSTGHGVKLDSRYAGNSDPIEVEVIVKGPHVNLPPWAIVANSLDSDVSVASWWDDGYGIPNICAGDAFGSAPNKFCLEDERIGAELLPPEGRARFNIENLIEAT